MKATVTPEAAKAVGEIAARHVLSQDAVLTMLFALRAGGGTMAQFNIPELGGSGQWMRGGMTLVGNMFDNALKARVDALCNELVQLLATTTVFPASSTQSQIGFSGNNWWPADLGVPSAVGAQNNVRYAFSRPLGGWLSRSTVTQKFSIPAITTSAAYNSSRAAGSARSASPASSARSAC